LWKWGLGILAVGFVVGIAVDASFTGWMEPPERQNLFAPDSEEPEEPQTPPDDPHYQDRVKHWEKIEQHAGRGEWGSVFLAIPKSMLQGWGNVGTTGLAILTGLCWMMFLLQTVQPADDRTFRLLSCIVGLLLGVVSIWFTLFLILYQEIGWGLAESDEFIPGLRFFVLGVGFREEVSKFICFLPLLPWIVRRRDELAALIVAGCVGLGFAMEENVGYIYRSAGSGTLGRLLTPAPIHIALTGLIGLAAYRACRWPKEWGPQFVVVFLGAILMHGAYDALIVLPDLKDYSIGAFILFFLLQWHFFRELRELRIVRRETISLSANFITCVALVAAATFVYMSAATGWSGALDIMFMSVLGQAMMVYLFLREMPESLVTV
ncbi:MAG: PrsW family glutamic-type intramembrane protease, partial [Lacipirellulaceae bacterium]